MKTNQTLIRTFMGSIIRQEHKTKFFCINDLTAVANEYRKSKGLSSTKFDLYHKSQKTQEFISSLMEQKDLASVIRTKEGKNGGTWAHPMIFLDYAMWLNPDFKVKMFDWIMDHLAEFRDESGESYKKLASTINTISTKNPIEIQNIIITVAKGIKTALKVDDWNSATEQQLKNRDEMHKSLILLIKARVDLQTAFNVSLSSISIDKEVA